MSHERVDRSVPEGIDFIRRAQEVADVCGQHTDHYLPMLGKTAPQICDNLGTVLSFLYRMGACWWGCRGGDHLVEYIVGRSSSTALAALSLMRFGYYDEALSLVRNVGEAANLLALFNRENSSLEKWRSSNDRSRKSQFSPVKVRLAVEKLGLKGLGIIDEARYRKLSTVGTHLSPQTKPQNFNPMGVATLGALFQEIGVLVTLNEIATAIGFLAPPAAMLLKLPKDSWLHLKPAVINLLSSVGRIQATELDEVMRVLRDKLTEMREQQGS